MRQTVAGDKLTLHRYDGVDGERKSKMARIGFLPLDTKPDAIPKALVDDLTPRELRELEEFLRQEQGRRAVQKLAGLRSDLDDLLASAAAGMLGAEQIAELAKLTAEFSKGLRRIGANRKNVTPGMPVT